MRAAAGLAHRISLWLWVIEFTLAEARERNAAAGSHLRAGLCAFGVAVLQLRSFGA